MKALRNRVIDLGVLLVVAAALIWLGAEFTRRVEWILPYVAGLGVALMLGGVGLEVWRRRRPPVGST